MQNPYFSHIPDIVKTYMEKIGQITGRNYRPFDYYGDSAAETIIIAIGSVCDTIKEVLDDLNRRGEKVGLKQVRLYRPFSEDYFFQALPSQVRRIAVLDRTKEPGAPGEPLYLDICRMFAGSKNPPQIVGGRWGLGSDGTVGANKSAYQIIGENTNGRGPAWANSLFEDNAEYGYGMFLGTSQVRARLRERIYEAATDTTLGEEIQNALKTWLDKENDGIASLECSREIHRLLKLPQNSDQPLLLKISELADYLEKHSYWMIDGDVYVAQIAMGADFNQTIRAMKESGGIIYTDTIPDAGIGAGIPSILTQRNHPGIERIFSLNL